MLWAGLDSNQRSENATGLQPVPFGHSGTDPDLIYQSPFSRLPEVHAPMPTFDVVSEVDMQEVRNAVDQAQRELATRFDFKNTDSTVDLHDMELRLHSAT